MKLRRLIIAVAVMVAVLVFSNVPTRAADPVQIKLWLLTDVQTTYEQMVKDFNDSHPDIQVKLESRGTDALKEALRQVLNTDAAPDIFFNWGASGLGLGGYYIQAGGVEPIQRYFDKYHWTDRFNKAE